MPILTRKAAVSSIFSSSIRRMNRKPLKLFPAISFLVILRSCVCVCVCVFENLRDRAKPSDQNSEISLKCGKLCHIFCILIVFCTLVFSYLVGVRIFILNFKDWASRKSASAAPARPELLLSRSARRHALSWKIRYRILLRFFSQMSKLYRARSRLYGQLR